MFLSIFAYAWIRAQSLALRAWSSIAFDSRVAQAVIASLLCPLVEPTLLVGYGFVRGILSPWCQLRWSRPLQSFVRKYYLPTLCSVLCRIPVISYAIQELLIAIVLGLARSTRYYDDVRTFLCLTMEQAIRFGSGSFYNPYNCFFSAALASGPAETLVIQAKASTRPNQADLSSSIQNLQISQTLLYLCILGYHDTLIRPGMQSGMLPGATYYTTSTDNLSGCGNDVHMVCHPQWVAVVLTPRFEDWFKYLILGEAGELVTVAQARTPTTITTATVRKDFYSLMLRIGNSRLEYLGHHPAPHPDSRRHNERQSLPSPGASVTVFQFLQFLSRRGHRLYITGHSLGGALAPLLAFHLRRAYHVNATAVVTFGAPPVGNDAFGDLYAHQVPVTWSFVNGVELGPLIPPLPFMDPGADPLWMVGQRVDAKTPLGFVEPASAAILRRVRNRQCSLEAMDEIAETEQLPLVFLNHNPLETLFCVKTALSELHNRQGSEMVQHQDVVSERYEDKFSDTESELFYSAPSSPVS